MTNVVYCQLELYLVGQALDDIPWGLLSDDLVFALFMLDRVEVTDESALPRGLYAIVRDPTDTAGHLLVLFSTDDLQWYVDGLIHLAVKCYGNALKDGETPCMGFRVYHDTHGDSSRVEPYVLSRVYKLRGHHVVLASSDWSACVQEYGDWYASLVRGKLNPAILGYFSGRWCLPDVLAPRASPSQVMYFGFTGNVGIKSMGFNGTSPGFVMPDIPQAEVALDGVSISVDPADAYDEAAGVLTNSCTITATATSAARQAVRVTDGALLLSAVSGQRNKWTYEFSNGADIGFTAFPVLAMEEIWDEGGSVTYTDFALGADTEIWPSEYADHAKITIYQSCTNLVNILLADAGDFTLDLNGCTVRLQADCSGATVCVDAPATIADSSTGETGRIIGCDSGNGTSCCVLVGSACTNLVIRGGIFDGTISMDASYVSDGHPVYETALTIAGGAFRASEHTVPGSDPAAFVYAGTYWKYVDHESPPEERHYLAEGKKAVLKTLTVDGEQDDYWVVEDSDDAPATVAEAIRLPKKETKTGHEAAE